MKRIFIVAFLVLIIFVIVSCSNEILKKDTVELSFGFAGKFDSITQTPIQSRSLSRAEDDASTSKNWYAIQVYDETGPYAYGFFDNIEDMKLLCVKGTKYSFAVDMIPEAEGKVYKFSLVQAGWAPIGNSFYYSKTESVRYLGEGYLYMNYPENETFNRPAVDRFFGTLSNYTATDNGTVNIELTRRAFSTKFVAKDFTEGSLEISLDNAPTFTIKASETTEFEHFYSFNNLSSVSEEIGVSIIWINAEGQRIPIVAQNVTFARNTLTTLEFTVKASESSNTFSITSDEELTEGGTITLDKIEDLVDTEIDPENNTSTSPKSEVLSKLQFQKFDLMINEYHNLELYCSLDEGYTKTESTDNNVNTIRYEKDNNFFQRTTQIVDDKTTGTITETWSIIEDSYSFIGSIVYNNSYSGTFDLLLKYGVFQTQASGEVGIVEDDSRGVKSFIEGIIDGDKIYITYYEDEFFPYWMSFGSSYDVVSNSEEINFYLEIIENLKNASSTVNTYFFTNSDKNSHGGDNYYSFAQGINDTNYAIKSLGYKLTEINSPDASNYKKYYHHIPKNLDRYMYYYHIPEKISFEDFNIKGDLYIDDSSSIISCRNCEIEKNGITTTLDFYYSELIIGGEIYYEFEGIINGGNPISFKFTKPMQ